MILSSHYVIQDILRTVERKDLEEIKKTCTKYCRRYRNDEALAEVCSVISMDLGKLDEQNLAAMRSRLEELCSARKLESSGGSALWFSDRRKSIR
ncbi:MAG: hypothetical protein JW724_03945 [Candidatus Altiarchaeota archaeon]|nr:hypothetical protein [Candidatus Altiarchaeota archaeon]